MSRDAVEGVGLLRALGVPRILSRSTLSLKFGFMILRPIFVVLFGASFGFGLPCLVADASGQAPNAFDGRAVLAAMIAAVSHLSVLI